MELSKAAANILESQEVVVLIDHRIAGVNGEHPTRAHRKRGKRSKWISDFVENTSTKIEAKDVWAAFCPPYFSAAHMYVAKESGLLHETVPAKVVTIDLGTSVESPYFIRVTTILVARTHLDEIKSTRNL